MENVMSEIADEAYLMANLPPRLTGLPMTVWAQPSSGLPHDARIKVSPVHGRRMILDDAAVVGIRPSPWLVAGHLSPADLQAVSDWVRLNQAALLDYWDFTIDTDEFLARLQRLP
jgi:hypothetical protein